MRYPAGEGYRLYLIGRMRKVKEARRHTALGLESYASGDLETAEWEFRAALTFAGSLGPAVETARLAQLNLAIVQIKQEKYAASAALLGPRVHATLLAAGPEAWEPRASTGFYEPFERTGSPAGYRVLEVPPAAPA